jgi:hypothetical protein
MDLGLLDLVLDWDLDLLDLVLAFLFLRVRFGIV